MKHEKRAIYLTEQLRKHDEAIKVEWNREASATLTLVTLGLFIGTAVILLRLFVDLWP